MGAHYSPPFAIIFISFIEQKALKTLRESFDLNPRIYARYIDDIIVGPFYPNDLILNSKFLEVFNGVHNDIQFTIEIPDKVLNFLDISIEEKHNAVSYGWYIKEQHSGIYLNKSSHLPNHVKRNYITNSINYVQKRCSDPEKSKIAIETFKNNCRNNGFSDKDFTVDKSNKNKKKKQYTKYKANLTLDFVSDRTNKQIHKLMDKYDIKANLISKPNKSLSSALNNKSKNEKHKNCHLCNVLNSNYRCNDRFIVYKFTCKLCTEFYIGKSSRPFYLRYAEHRNSINAGNKVSALSDHLLQKHQSHTGSIDYFDVQIIDKCRDPVDTTFSESRQIRSLGL